MEENENQILKTLLSDLHRYITSDTDINDSHFELPSTIKPGTPVAKHYRQALDIYNKFKEIKRAHTVAEEEKLAKKKRSAALKIIKEKEKQIQGLENDNTILKENLQIQKESNIFIDKNWKCDRDQLKTSLARLETTEKQTAQLKEAYNDEVSKSQIQRKQIDDLQREREELLNRFSKLAGDMLKHENTDLTDLSDADRPTKLSDAYSELYDNEWTDAFEELTGRGLTENDAVVQLLDILLASFHKCRQITWERYQTLKFIASTIDIIHVPSSVLTSSETKVQGYAETLLLSNGHDSEVRNRIKENYLTSTMTLSTGQEREVKNIWRTTAKTLKQEAVKNLYTVLLTRFDTPIKDLVSTSKYLASCIDLCWKMGLQEKPMYIDTVAEKNCGAGMIFDLDKFTAYTKSGKRVEFVVWPALFLYEGGPMLFKGIAQGCNTFDS